MRLCLGFQIPRLKLAPLFEENMLEIWEQNAYSGKGTLTCHKSFKYAYSIEVMIPLAIVIKLDCDFLFLFSVT